MHLLAGYPAKVSVAALVNSLKACPHARSSSGTRSASTAKIAADLFGTHDFALHDMMAAYDTFAEAGKHNALKVVIRR